MSLYQVMAAFENTCLTKQEKLGVARVLSRNGAVVAHLLADGFTVQINKVGGRRVPDSYQITCVRQKRGFILEHRAEGWTPEPIEIFP